MPNNLQAQRPARAPRLPGARPGATIRTNAARHRRAIRRTVALLLPAWLAWSHAPACGAEPIAAPGGTGLPSALGRDQAVVRFDARGASAGEVVEILAQAGSWNLLVDPRLFEALPASSASSPAARPVTLQAKDTGLRGLLEQFLPEHGLTLEWNPQTGVARVTASPAAQAAGRARLYAEPLPKDQASTNLQEEIVEKGTPFFEVATRLIQETGLNVAWDPTVAAWAGQGAGATASVPLVDLHLSQLTSLQALAALLENHSLALVWNPALNAARITTAERRLWELEHPVAAPKPPLDPTLANAVQAVIFIDDGPLAETLQPLCDQLGLAVFFDPLLYSPPPGSGIPSPSTTVGGLKLRRASLAQALDLLMDTLSLAMVWEEPIGRARIAPKRACWDEFRLPGANPSPLPKEAGSAEVIPQIDLAQMPLEVAFQAMGRLAQVSLLLAPELADRPLPVLGKPVGALNARLSLQNASARQALLCLLAGHRLWLVWDDTLKAGRVVPKGTENPRFRLAPGLAQAVLGASSAPATAIQFDEMPLNEALGALARNAGLELEWDPALATGLPRPAPAPPGWPSVSFRWDQATPARALLALLGNYGLGASFDPASKRLRIALP